MPAGTSPKGVSQGNLLIHHSLRLPHLPGSCQEVLPSAHRLQIDRAVTLSQDSGEIDLGGYLSRSELPDLVP